MMVLSSCNGEDNGFNVMLVIDIYHLQLFNNSLSSTSFCLLSDLLLKIIFEQLYIHTYHDIVYR